MTVAAQVNPKVLAVWFKDFHRWDFGFFRSPAWAWPADELFPLGTFLEKKHEEVAPTLEKSTLPIIEKISFGGVVSVVGLEGRSKYKGRLFWADCGDLIYSKIRVKQGSLAIVPNEFARLAVSTEYPVYRLNVKRIDPAFLVLVLKSKAFLSLFEGLSHGGSTKTRISPSEFERQLIPVPPPSQQKAIVAHWRKAQDEIAAARALAHDADAKIQLRFLTDVGLKPRTETQQPKAYAVWWKDVFALSVRATFLSVTGASLKLGKYPVVAGRDCLAEVRHGCSASPSLKATGLEVLKISAVTRGDFMPSEKKYAVDAERVRKEFNLRKGDVLLCRTNGTLAYVGMSALVKDDMPNLIYPDKVIRVRAQDNILPEYLWQVLQSYPLRAQIEAAARTAVGNYAIGSEDIWDLQIPLPPVPVQREIMARVAAGREEIAREKAKAERLSREINAEIEALILGTKRVG